MDSEIKTQILNLCQESNLQCSLTLLLDYGEEEKLKTIHSDMSSFGGSRVFYSPDFLREPEHTKKLYDESIYLCIIIYPRI